MIFRSDEPLAKYRWFGLGTVVMSRITTSVVLSVLRSDSGLAMPDATLPFVQHGSMPRERQRGRETSFRTPSASTDPP